MKTKLLYALTALIMFGLTARADVEPNNSIAQAEVAGAGIITGDLGTAGDLDDYYILSLPADGEVTITLSTDPGLQARAAFYNSDGASATFGGFITGGTVSFDRDCVAAGAIYIRIDHNSGLGNYSVDVSLTSVPEANNVEPNNVIADAIPMAFEGTVTGHLGYLNGLASPTDGDDYYYTIPAIDGKIDISADLSNNVQARIVLYNNVGTILVAGSYSTTTATVLYDCLAADTVYIRLDQNSGCGGYLMTYNWEVVPFANDVESNDDFDNANPIAGFSEKSGHLGYVNLPNLPLDQNDYYITVTPTNGNINIQLITENSLQARILLYNKDRALLTSGSYVINDTTSLTYNCLREDTAYIRVDQNSGCGGYKMSYIIDSPDVARDVEPNNSFDDAIFIGEGIGSERTGHIGYVNGTSDQDDYYLGIPTVDGQVQIRIINDGAQQSRVVLYNDDRSTLTSSGYSTDTVFLNYDCMAGGDTVYFRVDNNSGCGGYRLFYDVIPNFTVNDPEPNNSFEVATPLGEGEASLRTGHLGYLNGTDNPIDNADYYIGIPADDGKIIIKTVSDNNLQSRIVLYNRNTSTLTSSGYVTADTNILVYDCLASDTIYMQVQRNSGCGGYEIWYEMENPAQANDAESNNVLADAIPLASNTAQEGHLGYVNAPSPLDGDDFYVYNPQDTGNLLVRVVLHNTLQARVRYYNSSGSLISSTLYITADTIMFNYNPPTGDTLYFNVDRNSGCGGYTIEIENGCPQATNLIEPLTISIGSQIDWDNAPGALTYNIRGRKASSPNYQVASGLSNSKYTAFPLQSCTNYNYGVESVCATRSSGFTADKLFSTLCAPYCPVLSGVNVVATTTTTATISWSNSIVSTGYQIQYSPTLGGPTDMVSIAAGTNNVTLTGLSSGTSYDFDLRQSCYDSGISPFTSGSFTTATFREGEMSDLTIFPNPADNLLFVQGAEANSMVTVYSAQGQRLISLQLSNGYIDLSELNPGWYTIKVEDKNLSIRTFSIVR